MLAILRASLFVLGNSLVLLIMLPWVLISPLLPFRLRYRSLYLWGRFVLWWARVILGIRHRVTGLENLPAGGGALVLAKHQSTWETLFFPSVLHYPAFVLKRELLRIPIFGWGLAALRPIAIDRGAGRKALQAMASQSEVALAVGRDVVIFPEGTRRKPGAPPHYRIGAAVVAARTGRPVIPVALNSGRLWPKGSFTKPAGIIDVVIGPPIASAGRKPDEILADVEAWIEGRMATLTPDDEAADARSRDKVGR